MRKIKQLIIIGNGGHSRVVQSIIKQTDSYQLLEIWDDSYEEEIIDMGIRYKPIPKKKCGKCRFDLLFHSDWR